MRKVIRLVALMFSISRLWAQVIQTLYSSINTEADNNTESLKGSDINLDHIKLQVLMIISRSLIVIFSSISLTYSSISL